MASLSDRYGGYCTCTRDKCSNDCEKYRRYKPKPTTNYDRIISKTPEELAEWVWSAECAGRAYGPMGKKAWLDWLQQEAD